MNRRTLRVRVKKERGRDAMGLGKYTYKQEIKHITIHTNKEKRQKQETGVTKIRKESRMQNIKIGGKNRKGN